MSELEVSVNEISLIALLISMIHIAESIKNMVRMMAKVRKETAGRRFRL